MPSVYLVYCARYKTKEGTLRRYYGHTKCMNLRRMWHRRKPPAWMKPMPDDSDVTIDIVEAGLPSREDALASEALHSARAMVSDPDGVRGGPWVKPTLPHGALAEVQAVAPIRCFRRLWEVAEAMKGGLLWKHLKDLDFVPSATATRGAVIGRKRKSGRSGCTGSTSRKNQIARKVLKPGSAMHKRLHRGIDPMARRAAEQQRRPHRTRTPAQKRKRKRTMGSRRAAH